jgi:NAD(P)-dependent dehydrogenase (short-subunit alcohol dehydrogenase family)
MPRAAIITGGSRGLGLETARQFAAAGARVAILDIAPPAPEDLGGQMEFHPIDMGDSKEVPEVFGRALGSIGRIDALVNNVGIAGPAAAVEATPLADWQATLRVNLDGAFVCCQLALPVMKAAGTGSIVNISTSSVQTALPYRAAYVTSKAALEALTRVIAREAGQFGIRANTVRPGAMDNERLDQVISRVAQREGKSRAEVEAMMLKYISMRTKVSMSDVASMVTYLCSDAARHITGQTIAVDAGFEWEI